MRKLRLATIELAGYIMTADRSRLEVRRIFLDAPRILLYVDQETFELAWMELVGILG